MKELNVDLGTTGLTVTASTYLLGVLKASGIACAEIGVTGKYSGDFAASPNVAGVYQVAFFVGAETVSRGGGIIQWDGSAEVLPAGSNDILSTALTEGYAADGATATLEQLLYMIWSMLCDKAIAGTTLTTRKLDGSTTAMTFTLAPTGTAPISQARAS